MTRLASIVGVAAVATMILLSGCPTAVRVDLAKRLVGTWETEPLPGVLPIPADVQQAHNLPPQVEVTHNVTAVITDGPRHHHGDVIITITSTPTDAMTGAALTALTQQAAVTTTAAGTIYVRSSTEMQVEIASIVNSAFDVPEQMTIQLQDVPLQASYELADDVLQVTSDVLFFLGVVGAGEALTLTR